MMEINSRGNPRFKRLRGLKPGFGSGEILVEGIKLVHEALGAGLVPLEAWTSEDVPGDLPCAWYRISPDLYRQVSPTKTGNPPLVVFKAPLMAAPVLPSEGRWLVLDAVQDPGNAGGLVRAAAAFGMDGILWVQPGVYPYHHACIRGAAGGLFHLQHRLVDDHALTQSALPLIGASVTDAVSVGHFSWPPHFGLVMGNEGHGLRPAVRSALHFLIHIPTSGRVESLNVAGAAHILLYHAFRHPSTDSTEFSF